MALLNAQRLVVVHTALFDLQPLRSGFTTTPTSLALVVLTALQSSWAPHPHGSTSLQARSPHGAASPHELRVLTRVRAVHRWERKVEFREDYFDT